MGKWSGKPDKPEGGAGQSSKKDEVFDLFADMMIEKIKTIQSDWKKPWFTEGSMGAPKAIYGRPYNGMNAFMLMLHTERNGYKTPIYATHSHLVELNYEKTEKPVKGRSGGTPGARRKDEEGNDLPFVLINKGEKSFPVIMSKPFAIDKENQKIISKPEYDRLSEADKEKYDIRFTTKVYNVFNIDQTNLKEARPELYQKLTEEYLHKGQNLAEGEMLSFEPIDRMIKDNLYICPIKPMYGDDAYYSISKNEIVIPEKRQFKDGESFYSNLLHEMGHATGAESQLNRLKPTSFGSNEYAREELVAEMTAALVASSHGMNKHIKEDSAAYLKSWLDSLKEEPSFIKDVLYDVKHASSLIESKIEMVEQLIQKEKNGEAIDIRENDGLDDGIDETEDGPALGGDKKQGESEKHEESHSEQKEHEEQETVHRGGMRRR